MTDPKPTFKNEAFVVVDMSFFGGEGFRTGRVVGKGVEHVIDTWIVAFEKDFGPTYPYKVVGIPHTALVKAMPLSDFIAVMDKERGTTTDMEKMRTALTDYLKAPYTDKE